VILVDDGNNLRPEGLDLDRKQLYIPAGGESRDFEASGIVPDDIAGIDPDGPR